MTTTGTSSGSRWGTIDHRTEGREKVDDVTRALVVYVDDSPCILSDFACLFHSFRTLSPPDTHLVVFAPEAILPRLPDGCVKVACERLEGKWSGYGYINSISCLISERSDVLSDYDRILRSDADTFLLPAWNDYFPSDYRVGRGLYANNQEIRDNLARVAQVLGLRYLGRTNLGSTHYGPSTTVCEVARLAFEIADYLYNVEFSDDSGHWPNWYRGVTTMYANELAVNHLIDVFERDAQHLDIASTSREPASAHAHVHCWHTDELFSKFAYRAGVYDALRPQDIDPYEVRFYCLRNALLVRAGAG
jgi:hypothetical protein